MYQLEEIRYVDQGENGRYDEAGVVGSPYYGYVTSKSVIPQRQAMLTLSFQA